MMKKTIYPLVLSFLCIVLTAEAQQGHFKIRNDEFVQIGYDNYKALTLGIGNNTPNNGQWGLEHWNGGLNIWRPWPTFSWGNYKLFIKDWDGFVGIGKYPLHQLDVEGDIATYGTLQVTSDERLKKNINNLDSKNCLNSLMRVTSISYNYKYDRFPYQGPTPDEDGLTEVKQKTIQPFSDDKGEKQAQVLRHGFLAQDLKEVFPTLVSVDDAGFYSIDYIGMIPITVAAIKEQQQQIDEMKNKIENLEKIIQELQRD